MVDDAASGKVKKCVVVLLQMLVGNSSAVEGFEVFVVHRKSCARIFDHLLPLGQDIPASGAVGVEDGIGFAQDGFSVQFNGAVVIL